MKFIIIGAGIGGLSTAIALQKAGYEVAIYEAATELKALGAGLVLAGNAVKAFKYMGVDTQVLQRGNMLNSFQVLTQKGEIITANNHLKASSDYGVVASFAIHRGDLQAALLDCIPNIPILLGKKCSHFERKKEKMSLFFEDKTHVEADYVIATDGIHSVFRKQLVSASQIRFAKQTCWRGISTHIPENMPMDIATETWGKSGRFGVVPLVNGQAYWFAVLHSNEVKSPHFKAFGKKEIAQSFADFHQPIPQLIENTPENAFIWNDIIDFSPIKQFAFENILLLGDAAHATTPNMGQGACMAIEDAAFLLSILQKERDITKAFQIWKAKRISRTTQIVNRSFMLGKVAMWQNDFAMGVRNFLLRNLSEKSQKSSLDFLFGVEFE